MIKEIEGKLDASGQKIAIIVSRFNDFITSKLLEGALDCLKRHGATDENINLFRVPGSFEIPFLAKKLAISKKYDGVICLGAIIKGATDHYQYVAAETTKGIAHAAMESGIPIIFGVLTTDNIEQAIERAGTKSGNKGFDAALTAVELINLYKMVEKK